MNSLPESFVRLEALRSRHNILDFINPTNADQAKLKFFEGTDFQLEYRSNPADLQETLDELRSLEFGDHLGAAVYELARSKAVQNLELIAVVGTSDFVARADEQDKPTSEEVSQALQVLEQESLDTNKVEREPVTAQAVMEAIQTELEQLGLSGWQAVFGTTLARCRVVTERREVELNPTAVFRTGDDQKLIVHEVHGHVLRAANGATQPLPILAFGLPDYGATEEGITNHLEQRWGLKVSGVGGARHVIAIDAALRGDFRSTFDAMRPFCKTDDAAFRLALRAKRGTSDLRIPGAFLKDLVYWRGERQLDAHFKKGGSLEALYVGKVGVSHLPMLEPLLESGWVQAPKWLPPHPPS